MRYATRSLTPSTSRNSRVSAPGTTPARQVAPPLVVTTYVPPVPLAQATRALTGLMACSRLVVPLCCGVRVGAVPRLRADTEGATGVSASEQASAAATIDARIEDRKSTRLNSSHSSI